jgi:Spx/MgsR family transcriptional regulator
MGSKIIKKVPPGGLKELNMNKIIDFYCWNSCNTCRQTKAYLVEKGYELNYRDFFKEPFTKSEIQTLLSGRPAAEMFNARSPSVKDLGINSDSLTSDEMIELMLVEPRLIRRPIVRVEGRIHFGTNIKLLEQILT